MEGEGQELRFDGSRYFGQFLNGKKTGRCLIYFKDGCKYINIITIVDMKDKLGMGNWKEKA